MLEDFNIKGRRKKSPLSKVLILVLVIVLVILTKATFNVFLKNKEAQANLMETQMDFNELKDREENLSGEIKNLKTERGVDKEIREKFRVVKEGEEMIVLVDFKEDSEEDSIEEEKSLWKRFLDLF